jgi:hypothetical protein
MAFLPRQLRLPFLPSLAWALGENADHVQDLSGKLLLDEFRNVAQYPLLLCIGIAPKFMCMVCE